MTELVKMVTPCLTPQKGLRGEEGRGELGRVDRAVGQLTAHLQGCLRQLIGAPPGRDAVTDLTRGWDGDQGWSPVSPRAPAPPGSDSVPLAVGPSLAAPSWVQFADLVNVHGASSKHPLPRGPGVTLGLLPGCWAPGCLGLGRFSTLAALGDYVGSF